MLTKFRILRNVFDWLPNFHVVLFTFNQTWAQDTFKISSSRVSSYFYIQDKNQVLCSLKKYKLKQESLVSRKFKQEFYVSIKLKQAKRESSDSSIEQKTQNISSFNSTCWLDIR